MTTLRHTLHVTPLGPLHRLPTQYALERRVHQLHHATSERELADHTLDRGSPCTARETTRALVARIAAVLAERWEAAARPPPSTSELPEDSEERPTVHADTLDAMLDLRGNRGKRA